MTEASSLSGAAKKLNRLRKPGKRTAREVGVGGGEDEWSRTGNKWDVVGDRDAGGMDADRHSNSNGRRAGGENCPSQRRRKTLPEASHFAPGRGTPGLEFTGFHPQCRRIAGYAPRVLRRASSLRQLRHFLLPGEAVKVECPYTEEEVTVLSVHNLDTRLWVFYSPEGLKLHIARSCIWKCNDLLGDFVDRELYKKTTSGEYLEWLYEQSLEANPHLRELVEGWLLVLT
jgi:hypothetical protein